MGVVSPYFPSCEKCRRLIFGVAWRILSATAICLVLIAYAYKVGQPYGILVRVRYGGRYRLRESI